MLWGAERGDPRGEGGRRRGQVGGRRGGRGGRGGRGVRRRGWVRARGEHHRGRHFEEVVKVSSFQGVERVGLKI